MGNVFNNFIFQHGKNYQITFGVAQYNYGLPYEGWHQNSTKIHIADYNLDFINETIPQNNYASASHITMDNAIIKSPDHISMEAGVEIHLMSGTSIKAGSVYHASIDPGLPCYNGQRSLVDTNQNNSSTLEMPKTSPQIAYIKNSPSAFNPPKPLSNETKTAINGAFNNNFLFPNPTNSKVSINYSAVNNDNISINVYSSLGIQLDNLIDNKSHEKGQYKIEYDTTSLLDGIYLVEIKTKNGSSLLKLNVFK